MSVHVSTRMKRFRLVKKSLSEVGDGTDFSMLVTPDQLAEVMYRVKDAAVTSGQFEASDPVDDPFPETHTIAAQGSPPSVLISSGGAYGECVTMRGFVAIANEGSDPLPDEPLFRFSASYEVSWGGPKVNAKDIQSDERGMWVKSGKFWDDGTTSFPMNYAGVTEPGPFRTAFDFFSGASNDDPSSVYGIFGTSTLLSGESFISEAGLNFSGEVAWVDVDESNNPYSPGNKLYLGAIFEVDHVASPANPYFELSTDVSILLTSYESAGFNLRLELASGTLTAPIYVSVHGYDGTWSGSDFVFEATEWWPYAKGSPAVPVWDESNGLKL